MEMGRMKMKMKWTSLLAMVIAVTLCLSCFGITAFAAETQTQYGLEAMIVTDKEHYQANEEIHVTVTVKNTNDFEVKNVSIESLLPEALTLKDGSTSTKTVDLEPGGTLTLSFTAVKEKEETSATQAESQSTEPTETEPVIPSESETVKPSETETVKPSESETLKPSETETQKPTQAPTTEQPTQGTTTPRPTEPTAPAATTEGTTLAQGTTGTQSTTDGIIGDLATTFPKTTTPADSSTTAQAANPDTGDSMSVKTLAIAVIALLALIAIVMILMCKYKRQTTKLVSLVMCVAVAATAITGVSFFTAEGVDDGRKSFTVEKGIAVDGEETSVGAEVKYQEDATTIDIDVHADTFDILVGEKKEVTFYAESLPESGLIIKDSFIELYSDDGFVGKLYDNGEESDVAANDGIFSGRFLLSSEKRQVDEYFIKYRNQKSKKTFAINFYQKLTEEEKSQVNTLKDNINAIKSKYIWNDEKQYNEDAALTRVQEAYDEIMLYLSNCNNLQYDVSNLGILVTFHFNYNYIISLNALIDDIVPQAKGDTEQNKRIQKTSSSIKNSTNSKIITLQPSYNGFPTSKYDEAAEAIAKADSNYVFETNLDNEQVTIETMKTLADYRIIIIDGHGGDWSKKGVGYVLQMSGSMPKDANEEEESYRIIEGDGCYFLTQAFFEKYYSKGDFENSLIYLSTCNGGNDTVKIRNILREKGAKAVLAYKNNVTNIYSEEMDEDVFNEFAKGLTMGEAVQRAKDKHGESDPYLFNTLSFLEKLKYRLGILAINPAELILEGDFQLNEGNGAVHGRFIDAATKIPLQAEYVIREETSNGKLYNNLTYSTDDEGNFSVSLPEGHFVLEVHIKDYITNYVDVYPRANIEITLGDVEISQEPGVLPPDPTDPTPGIDDNFAGGDGSRENPYQIATVEQLNAVRNHLSSHFILINDINFSDCVDETGKQKYFEPIGRKEKEIDSFTGTFDGHGHTIKNLKMKGSNVGLFVSLKNSTVQNLDLQGIDIVGSSSVGSVSAISNNSIIKNCNVTGTIEYIYSSSTGQREVVGGISGTLEKGKIENCYYTGNIESTIIHTTGGIAGWNKGEIINSGYKGGYCYGGYATGGIAGYNYGKITNSFNKAFIGSNYRTRATSAILYFNLQAFGGGIAAYNAGIITGCYNAGSIYGWSLDDYYIGEISGIAAENQGTISYCYNTGNVYQTHGRPDREDCDNESIVAGITSYNKGEIFNCYNIGNLDSDSIAYYFGAVPGDTGIKNVYFSDSLYTNYERYGYKDGGEKRSEQEMKSDRFVGLLNEGASLFVKDKKGINNGFPILKWQDS